ncbi:hypothetical protein WKW50_23220, partial [Ochrobactrum sp. GPK 3]
SPSQENSAENSHYKRSSLKGAEQVVAAGWLAATLAGAVGGAVVGGVAGGLFGALTESGVSKEDAHLYAEGVRRGGSLVTARVADGRVPEADAILAGASPVDINARRKLYVQEGWQRFDANADPYTEEEIERERSRYL